MRRIKRAQGIHSKVLSGEVKPQKIQTLRRDSVYLQPFEWYLDLGVPDTKENRKIHAQNVGTSDEKDCSNSQNKKQVNWMLELLCTIPVESDNALM